MTDEIVASDIVIVDLLRKHASMTVIDLASALEVTATAVRQRLTRLMAQGFVERSSTKAGRGRPSHFYVAHGQRTAQGRLQSWGSWRSLCGRRSLRFRTRRCGGS